MTSDVKDEVAPASELDRLMAAARDSLSDEMVGRLAGFCSDGLDIMDRASRSGLAQALPVLAEMVNQGDLERMAQLARVYHSVQDALTDEMVGRLAETLGEGLSLLDRLNRSGIGRLVQMLERMESSGDLEKIAHNLPILLDKLDRVTGLLECLEASARLSQEAPASTGLGGLWQLLTRRETQQSLQFLVTLGQQMQEQCRKP